MTAELGDWLAELGESEPKVAAEVGAALVAVLADAEPSGVAIVGQPGRSPEPIPDDPRATADYAYQRQLERLQLLRRRVADAASQRQGAELRLSEQRAARTDAAVLDRLSEQLAAAQQREAALAHASQRLQAEIDAFRTAKETAKARFTAAEASLRVAEAVAALGGEPDPDLAQRREDYRAAEEQLRSLHLPGPTVGVVRHPSDPADTGLAEAVAGLLELRADPLGSDIRILFAAEPAETITLLAVLEGSEAVREHGARAIALAGELLTEIRDGGWPADIDEVELAGPDAFLARFFPADDGSIGRRASVLASLRSLRTLRVEEDLTIEEVAARSGLSVGRVAAIERGGLRTASVHEAVALARTLNARLELPSGSGPVAS